MLVVTQTIDPVDKSDIQNLWLSAQQCSDRLYMARDIRTLSIQQHQFYIRKYSKSNKVFFQYLKPAPNRLCQSYSKQRPLTGNILYKIGLSGEIIPISAVIRPHYRRQNW